MCRFIETIRIDNGTVFGLNYHQDRVNKTFREFFSDLTPFSLGKLISQKVLPNSGLYKLRVIYDAHQQLIELYKYNIPEFYTYNLIEIENNFDYKYKSADRNLFDSIASKTKKGVLPILVQKKMINDSIFSNLVFEKGRELFTPKAPLLFGTMLTQTVQKYQIKQISIYADEIKFFDYIYSINAMNPLSPIKKIKIQ